MKITTVTIGNYKMGMATDVYYILKSAKLDYEADVLGLADVGESLNSDFYDYINLDKLEKACKLSGSKLTTDIQIDRFVEFFSM